MERPVRVFFGCVFRFPKTFGGQRYVFYLQSGFICQRRVVKSFHYPFLRCPAYSACISTKPVAVPIQPGMVEASAIRPRPMRLPSDGPNRIYGNNGRQPSKPITIPQSRMVCPGDRCRILVTFARGRIAFFDSSQTLMDFQYDFHTPFVWRTFSMFWSFSSYCHE